MQFTKRMWITMLAAVLLVAGGLLYFAVAADVEPYYVTHPCLVEGCDAEVHEEYDGIKDEGWETHKVNNRDCHYDYKEIIYKVVCDNHHSNGTHTRKLKKNHEFCGAPDQY